MTRHLAVSLAVLGLVACAAEADDPVVAGADACYALGLAVDDAPLSSSGMSVRTPTVPGGSATYTFPEAEHGATYVCTVNTGQRRITQFTKNGTPILNQASEDIRDF